MLYKTFITPEELNDLTRSGKDIAIADCRFSLADEDQGLCDYYGGHIPGAVYVHLNDELSGPIIKGKTGRHPLPDPESAAGVFSDIGIGAGTQVIVYDEDTGAFAARMWWMLRWLGHENAAVLEGGIQRWKQEGFPVDREDTVRNRTDFKADIQKDMAVELEEVIEMVETHSAILVDARAAERYRGENETIDIAAGHIPGAFSAPYSDNLDQNGLMKPIHLLKERFEPFYAKGRPVFYCGSGVTSCHNILACVHAGLEEPLLYPGSWSEWCADSSRPIATGDEKIRND